MEIKVLLFAQFRDAAGCAEVVVEVEGQTVRDALSALTHRYPKIEPLLRHAQTALDEEYCQADALLHEGATLALIPPVSGGER